MTILIAPVTPLYPVAVSAAMKISNAKHGGENIWHCETVSAVNAMWLTIRGKLSGIEEIWPGNLRRRRLMPD